MRSSFAGFRGFRLLAFSLIAVLLSNGCALAQSRSLPAASPSSDAADIYHQLQAFPLLPKAFNVDNLLLRHDRVVITFLNGKLFFGGPVAGKVRGPVFIGVGKLHADTPPAEHERDNVRRLLGSDNVDVDFNTAVLRFTTDAYEVLSKGAGLSDETPGRAQELAAEVDGRFLKQNGVNLSSRVLESILNHESEGFFYGYFEGHKRKFSYLFDPLAQIPTSHFEINCGEKGMLFSYQDDLWDTDVWTAFYDLQEYAEGKARYSEQFNLIDTPRYRMEAGLLEPKRILDLKVSLDAVSRVDGLRVIPFTVGEDLGSYDDESRKKQMHVRQVRLSDGTPINWMQEPWEGGFTVVLPQPISRGANFTLEIELHGDFMMESSTISGTYFPRRTTTWYPRHGDLQRSQFEFKALTRKRDHVASIGDFVGEEPAGDGKKDLLTTFHIDDPIALTSFAVGPYEIHRDVAKQQGRHDIKLEFYSLPGSYAAIKEDFILAEMNNAIRYFGEIFGEYPYPVFRAVYHPFAFGQGFPSTIMIPAADRSSNFTFSFIAHETSHQWWGDMVLWRSYRDQWLSEGFAEYSGMLYTQLRDKTKSEKELIRLARDILLNPPRTTTGIGKGRVADVGPLILGHRLATRETENAYYSLTYYKGALVLRMLHFLFTDPTSGNSEAFFEMMTDFVRRYKGRSASTEDFIAVVNEHVPKTPLAQRYGYKDLSWFFRQWVFQSYLPSYRMSYRTEDAPGGGFFITGEVFQEGLPATEQWQMLLPVVVDLGNNRKANATVAAVGPRTPFRIKIQEKPQKVELDPGLWVLSEHTSTHKQ